MGLKDKAKSFIDAVKKPKELPGKVSFYLKHEKEKVRKTYRRYLFLKKKIKNNQASLKDRLEYRSHRASLLLVPVNAALVTVVPGGILAAGGLAASKSSISGDKKSNKDLLKKVRSGEKLSFLEKLRLKKADI